MNEQKQTTKTPIDGYLAVSGSALIAEFMQIKEIESSHESYGQQVPFWYSKYLGYRTPAFSVTGKSLEHLLSENKFNNSWDWLMPVVEKIELECKYDVHIYAHYNWKEPNRCSIVDWKNNKIVDTSNDSKFQCVFDAIVEFVKWWNAKQADR